MAPRPSTELRLELIEARLRAHEVALQWLFKAIASIDPGSGQGRFARIGGPRARAARAHRRKENETLRCLRRVREQLEELQLLGRATFQ